ncbi:MAG: radical SAM protein, partial [Oscillospiraceae bacterium]|nr:radical SAM protein [Oscillospiraceae bacterium]
MKAVCPICPRACLLEEGQTGFCRGRKNIGGEVLPVNYGRITSLALDPVEKKPLRRFHPGKKVLSLGLFG